MRLTNSLPTGQQTTVIGFVPQRSTDQSNQEFFLRIKVLSTDAVRPKLKRYEAAAMRGELCRENPALA